MTTIFVNKQKLALAEAEAALKGGEVKDIYLRMGGLVQEIDETTHQSEAPKPKAKSKKK